MGHLGSCLGRRQAAAVLTVVGGLRSVLVAAAHCAVGAGPLRRQRRGAGGGPAPGAVIRVSGYRTGQR